MKSSTLKSMLHMTSKWRNKRKKKNFPTNLWTKLLKRGSLAKTPDKPLSKKAKRDKFPLESGMENEPAQKGAAKGADNKKSSEEIAAKNAPSDDEGRQKSAKKPKHEEKHLHKAPTKLENKEKGEKAEQPKKHKLKEKPRNKPLLQSKGDGAALVLVKATSSGKELQILQEERALKYKKDASQKRMY
ncbi:hypothetical protein Cgig2_014529 [Carnegiea gigantea]|uniref:Uncharacterized protein n=1 Tax=Carnegiea gigantea TaxID=171969 RepID=A0A9Q1GNA6_9CARY|nr:hypothetical protein Cgig2_014529 [Carnegiea gigantea]